MQGSLVDFVEDRVHGVFVARGVAVYSDNWRSLANARQVMYNWSRAARWNVFKMNVNAVTLLS